MRHFLLLTSFSFFIFLSARAQSTSVSEADFTTAQGTLAYKAGYYLGTNNDSSLYCALKAFDKASKVGDYPIMCFALMMAGESYRIKGNFPRSLEMQLKALRLSRLNRDKIGEASTFAFIGFTFLEFGDYHQALRYLLPSFEAFRIKNDSIGASFTSSHLALCYASLGGNDSANYFNQESLHWLGTVGKGESDSRKLGLRQLTSERLGNVCELQGKLDQALIYYHQSLNYTLMDTITVSVSSMEKNLANIFEKLEKPDSAIFYARNAMFNSQLNKQLLLNSEAADILNKIYRKKVKADSALHYYTIAMSLRDSVFGVKKFGDLQLLMLNEQEEQQKLIIEKAEVRNKLRLSLVAVVAVALLVFALILRRNNRVKQVINRHLEEQKVNLENTLNELKSTQSQLIHSEKMASLGELTAGIAHEIQNPLNFVNNFSEVNQDLIADMKNEMAEGNINDAEAIAESIRQNEVKINHHGKRADAIVKGMLQHSRVSTGQKELTDINALADEYLRLSYHGMRAKDKLFNAEIQTDFDPDIGKISMIPQDIGRVLLNLYNNAFYAVMERKKLAGSGYEPLVAVATVRKNGQLNITVSDNGIGIPEKVMEKIFQPFFTTKPTGQGTGLGLSLSYDIVKAHSGELKVESTEGEGSELTVQLPVV